MENYLIKNITVVNEGKSQTKDVLIRNGRIEKISDQINNDAAAREINGEGKHLLPGAIDDQVHFREPGLTHKQRVDRALEGRDVDRPPFSLWHHFGLNL